MTGGASEFAPGSVPHGDAGGLAATLARTLRSWVADRPVARTADSLVSTTALVSRLAEHWPQRNPEGPAGSSAPHEEALRRATGVGTRATISRPPPQVDVNDRKVVAVPGWAVPQDPGRPDAYHLMASRLRAAVVHRLFPESESRAP